MRIKNIYIKSFRGIPEELNIDFTDQQGNAVSTIIYGDNGTGKSSIVDAIEFALQARIGRETKIKNSKRPSAISKCNASPVPAETILELDNGDIIKRGIEIVVKNEKTKYVPSNSDACKYFSIVPIALRRSDIISYNIISGIERQILFFKFIYKSPEQKTLKKNEVYLEIDPEVEELQNEVISLKLNRERLKSILASKLGISKYRLSITNKEAIDLCIRRNVVPSNGNPRQRTQNRKVVSQSMYDEIQRLSKAICEKQIEIKLVQAQINKLTSRSSLNQDARIQTNLKFFKEASLLITRSFKNITSADYIDSIELTFGDKTNVSLDIIIKLKNGNTTTPSLIFSEANYDLLILLFYVSIIRIGSNYGQEKVIILDDVLQSIDSQIRAKFINFLLREMSDWQIIITAHDRLWLNQLRFFFKSNNHKYKEFQISNWSFEHGPSITTCQSKDYDDSLEVAIKTKNMTLMASMAGLMLEKICQNLSIELDVSIKRKPDDKYTIGDLWPAIVKQLKKSPELETLVSEINESLYIRNLLSCHYNEWATSLSDTEIQAFAYNVQKLYDSTFCKNCLTWVSVSRKTSETEAQCRCQHKSILKKKN